MAAPAATSESDQVNKYLPPTPMISHSVLADDSKKWREKVPVGIRFKPNDQVLAGYYLAGKVYGRTHGPIFQLIREVHVHQCEPSLLSSLTYDFGDGKMYFFTHPFNRRNAELRHVPGGFWKKTGAPSFVKERDHGKKPIATKMTLVYYKKDQKSKPAEKTQWLMHEYMLLDSLQSPKQRHKQSKTLTAWTICVVYSSNQQLDAKEAVVDTQHRISGNIKQKNKQSLSSNKEIKEQNELY
ncbi:NAC domain-containing protein [Melia azedarach]|uniref:NAC domain-containing protein n=1 Tax=Melia azedarach TaxID=155640 RepID=A0ACC1XFM2_MELAZ|nr:NAC domain-containing protein [Melia azedarach]